VRIRLLGVAIVTAVSSGCGLALSPSTDSSTVVVEAHPVPHPYAGPMSVQPDTSDNATVLERSGAAGRALECDYEPYDGGGGDYDSGLESVQDSPAKALENFLEEELFLQLPKTGYQLEREDDGRALLSYDVGQRTKIAFIAADGIRDYEDDEGWGIETWAECDPAELPAPVTEALGIGVWQDRSGRRVPVAQIRSFQGPEHCSWQDVTFLELGPEHHADEYVGHPTPDLADWLKTTYTTNPPWPPGVTDTGFRQDGRELWLGPEHDAAYLVSRGDPTNVERWPAAKQPIGCD
jgi:hypothetical protein